MWRVFFLFRNMFFMKRNLNHMLFTLKNHPRFLPPLLVRSQNITSTDDDRSVPVPGGDECQECLPSPMPVMGGLWTGYGFNDHVTRGSIKSSWVALWHCFSHLAIPSDDLIEPWGSMAIESSWVFPWKKQGFAIAMKQITRGYAVNALVHQTSHIGLFLTWLRELRDHEIWPR